MTKQAHKDATLSIRINSEVLDQIKREAGELNISISDYLTQLIKDKNSNNDLATRVQMLENAVFRKAA